MDIISQVIEEQREYFKCHRDGDYRVESPILTSDYPEAVSYTHLDVYKRQ